MDQPLKLTRMNASLSDDWLLARTGNLKRSFSPCGLFERGIDRFFYSGVGIREDGAEV